VEPEEVAVSRVTTIVLAVLLFAGLAVAILVGSPAPPASPIPSTFLSFAASEVTALDLKTPLGEFRLDRDGKDRERWRLVANGTSVRAAAVKVEEILHELSRIAPSNFWKREEVRPGERKSWGLEAPEVVATLHLPAGPLRAALGAKVLNGQIRYAEREAGGDVYVVPVAGLASVDDARVETLRERSPVGFSTYEAKTLSVKRAGAVALEATKAGGGTWELSVPFRGPADPQVLDAFLAKVLGLRVVDFVADGTVDVDRYGFVEPAATVSVRREGRDAPLVLVFGGTAPDGKVWAMEEGEPTVFTVDGEVLAAIRALDPAAMRDRNLLRIGWAKVDSIEVIRGGTDAAGAAGAAGGWRLLRALDRWDVEKPERAPAETAEVERLLDEIRKIEVVRFLDGEDPAKHGLADPAEAPLRLVLAGPDETGHRTLLLGAKDAEGKVPARLLPVKGTAPGAGDSPLVLVDGAVLDFLAKEWLAWRAREVLKIDLAEVRGLERVTGEFGREAYVRDPAAGGSWKPAAEGAPLPDRNALDAALTQLLSLSCLSYERKTREGLEAWGLGEPPAGPAITVRLRRDGENADRTRTLVLGHGPEGEGIHFGRMADGDLVFRLPDHILSGGEARPLWELLNARWSKVEEPPAPETPK
jgi:hypothetical protein